MNSLYVFVNALHIMKQVHADMKALSWETHAVFSIYSIMWYSHHLLISLIYKKLVAHIIVKSSIQVFPVHMNTLCAICFSRIKSLSWDKKFVASCYSQLQYSSVCLFLQKEYFFSPLVANNPLGLFIDKHDPILLRRLVAVCYALKQTQQYFSRHNSWQIIRTG